MLKGTSSQPGPGCSAGRGREDLLPVDNCSLAGNTIFNPCCQIGRPSEKVQDKTLIKLFAPEENPAEQKWNKNLSNRFVTFLPSYLINLANVDCWQAERCRSCSPGTWTCFLEILFKPSYTSIIIKLQLKWAQN